MPLSQKCHYALGAVLELAKNDSPRPTKVSDIARTQRIPVKFLEAILSELKKGGFVESRRGSEGGYLLARPASRLTVGDIIRFVDGPLSPAPVTKKHSNLLQVFLPIWRDAEKALANVYDAVSFEELAERSGPRSPVDFTI